MKKRVVLIILAIVCLFVLSGCYDSYCNSSGQLVSGNRITEGRDVQHFDYAIVKLGNDVVVEGKIDQWRDYPNGDEIQLVINGKYYLTHYSNVVMVSNFYNGLSYSHLTGYDGVE